MTIPGSKITPIRDAHAPKPCTRCGVPRQTKGRDKYGICRDCYLTVRADGVLHLWTDAA